MNYRIFHAGSLAQRHAQYSPIFLWDCFPLMLGRLITNWVTTSSLVSQSWATQFSSHVDEIEQVVTGNRIWKQRKIGIGKVMAQEALDYRFSGIMLHGGGVDWDLRKVAPYDKYDKVRIPNSWPSSHSYYLGQV
jgi:hypothetical protein